MRAVCRSHACGVRGSFKVLLPCSSLHGGVPAASCPGPRILAQRDMGDHATWVLGYHMMFIQGLDGIFFQTTQLSLLIWFIIMKPCLRGTVCGR